MSTKPENADANGYDTPSGIDHGDAYRQEEVFHALKEEGEVTSRELSERMGLDTQIVRPALLRLKEREIVEDRPSIEMPNRNVYWVSDDE